MKSAWWWGSERWAEYQAIYHHGQVPDAYKTSPLADDHDFDSNPLWAIEYDLSLHQTVVLDLTQTREQLWQGVRKSYHSIIHRAEELFCIEESQSLMPFRILHHEVFGNVRSEQTFIIQQQWMKQGNAMSVVASIRADEGTQANIAAAFWILYEGCAYYMSGPSIEKNVQHAVIWKSIELLKAKGIRLVETGEVCDGTEKEVSVQHFKAGFGGSVYPFTVARRRP
jgi:hypothetical protein